MGVGGSDGTFHRRASKPFVNSTETVHGTVKNEYQTVLNLNLAPRAAARLSTLTKS
eukprot:SAG31_NODE_19469_length_600_cov_6.866267_1_plen_56_part_00